MSAPQMAPGYPAQSATYPQDYYGQPPPGYPAQASQQGYPPQVAQAPSPSPAPKRRGRMGRVLPFVFALLATISFTLAMTGFVITEEGSYGVLQARNECQYSNPTPTGCQTSGNGNIEAQAGAAADNDSATGGMLFFIGLMLGVLFSGLMGSLLLVRRMNRLDTD